METLLHLCNFAVLVQNPLHGLSNVPRRGIQSTATCRQVRIEHNFLQFDNFYRFEEVPIGMI